MLRGSRLLSPSRRLLGAYLCAHDASTATATERVNAGLIGAGQVGSAVASGLLNAGHTLKIYDPSRENAERLTRLGASWVDSPRAAAAGVDVLFTALPAPPHVRRVMEEEEALSELKQGACWIDHTTTAPAETKRLAGLAEARGVAMLEAPLTGGLELLKAGLMTVFVGGCPKLLAQHEALMRSYTATILHMGPIGNASVVKVLSNMLCAVHTVVTGEMLTLAKKNNVDLVNFFDGIRASAGNSFVFETETPLMLNGSYDPGFTLALHCKDLDIGNQLAREAGVPLEVTGLVEQIYRRAMYKYGDSAGSSHPPKLNEDDLNVSLRAEGFDDWTYTIEKVKGGGIGVVHHNIEHRGTKS